MPPVDLIEDVVLAWAQAGLDPVVCMRMCVGVTEEFVYDEKQELVKNRLRPRTVNNKTLPVRNRPLADVLDPQPRCSAVLHQLLEWIDRCQLSPSPNAQHPSRALRCACRLWFRRPVCIRLRLRLCVAARAG